MDNRDTKRVMHNKLFMDLLKDHYKSGTKFEQINAQDEWYLDVIVASGKITSSGLAKTTGVTKSAVTPVTKRLMNHGLVTRVQSDTDKRTYFLTATDETIEMYNKFYENDDTTLDQYMTRLTDDEAFVFDYLVKKVFGLENADEDQE